MTTADHVSNERADEIKRLVRIVRRAVARLMVPDYEALVALDTLEAACFDAEQRAAQYEKTLVEIEQGDPEYAHLRVKLALGYYDTQPQTEQDE
jgi:hypothetical protein